MNASLKCINILGRIIMIALFSLNLNLTVVGQQVVNGSFEGCPDFGSNLLAPEWKKCEVLYDNTPDIFPGPNNMWQPCSEGWFYVNLVVSETGKHEQISGKIDPPMLPGECYKISVDARASELMFYTDWDEFRDYTRPAKLMVNLQSYYLFCLYEYPLMTIDSIQHGQWWKTYSKVYTPSDTISSLELRTGFVSLPEYYGHVLVDNVRIAVAGDTISTSEVFVLPNDEITLKVPVDISTSSIHWEGKNISCSNCDSITIEAKEEGNYFATIYDSASCYYEVYAFHVRYEVTESCIQTIYPNPGVDYVNIYVPSNEDMGEIVISDENGRWTSSMTLGEEQKLVKFNTNELSPGVYFIALKRDGKIICREKWVKTLLK